MYNGKRQRLQTAGNGEWHFGGGPFRVASSHPTQRRTHHGVKRIFDKNKDYKRVESHRSDDTTQSQNRIAGRGNQFFNMTPKTFYHTNLHHGTEYTKQQTPLKEITMNCRKLPAFKYVPQDISKHTAGCFEYSPTNVHEQQSSDLFGDASYRGPQSFDVSPTKFSMFNDSSEFSSNSSSTNDFSKFSERNYHCLGELHSKSLECLNVSTHPVEKSWKDICRHKVKSVNEPSVGPYPETPESSRGRISPPERVYQRMSLLNEDFRDLSDDALEIPPMQVKLSTSDSSNVSPYFKSTTLPLEHEKTSNNFFQEQERTDRHPVHFREKFEPYFTDPDEEFAKMRSSIALANLPRENFRF